MGDAGDWKALYAAAVDGDVEACVFALECGVDPDYQHPEFGTTPLIAAAEAGQLGVVRALLDAGADPGVRAHWGGGDALETARANGHEAIVAALAATEILRRR
jgi:ankyrin repeat protein